MSYSIRTKASRATRAMKIKRPEYSRRHDRMIFQHDNARSHVTKPVKETLEALNISFLPGSQKMGRFVNNIKNQGPFSREIGVLPER